MRRDEIGTRSWALFAILSAACQVTAGIDAGTSSAVKTGGGSDPPVGETAVTPTSGTATTIRSLALSTGDLSPAFSPDVHEYEVSSMNALVPTRITVSGAPSTLLGETTSDGTPHVLSFGRLDRAGVLDITVPGDGGDVHYYVHVAPADLPTWSATANEPAKGQIFLDPFRGGSTLTPYLLVLNESGELLYYRRLTRTATDFKRNSIGGTTFYSYIQDDGAIHRMDADFHDMPALRIAATDAHASYNADIHDVRFVTPEHFFALATVSKVVDNVPAVLNPPANGALVAAAIIQEVDNDQSVFEWDSTQHPELYALSTEGNAFSSTTTGYADYMHVNALDLDPADGDLVVSFRHLDSILKLRRSDGSIAWRLGNQDDSFSTPAAQRTSHQHYARFLPDGRLMAFDNGNARGASRAVIYGLDPANHALLSFEEAPTGEYSVAMGSAQRMSNGNTFFGLGLSPDDALDVLELDAQGNHAFELRFDAPYYSYRAQKY